MRQVGLSDELGRDCHGETMQRPRLLDLFCCAGGAGMGYARRIIACVHACEGIPTSDLLEMSANDRGINWVLTASMVAQERDKLADEVEKLTAQRDEIAAEALHALKYIKQCLNDGIGIDALKEYRIDEAIAAIERVKPAGWCCPEGERLNVPMCPRCTEINNGFQSCIGVSP